MSRKKPNSDEDLFASVPPQETFDAFPALDAFPENAIAFLTGKAAPDAKPHTKPKKQPLLKSINQPAKQTVRQPDTASDNPPSNPSISPSARQSATSAASQPAPQPDSLPESPTLATPDRPAEAPTASPIPRPSPPPSASLPVTKPVSLSPSQTELPPLPQAPSQPLSRILSLSQGLSLNRARVGDRLNDNQKKVLDFLLAAKPYIIKFRDIAAAVGLLEPTVRTILRRLDALEFLTFKKARDGNIQGVRVAFNQHLIDQYLQDQTLGATDSPTLSHSNGRFDPPQPSPTANLSVSLTTSTAVSPSIRPSDPEQPLKKIDRTDSLSVEEANEFGWDNAFLAMMWPNAHKAGLRLEHLRQAVEARSKLGKGLDRETAALSLDRADWELEAKGRLTDLASGKEVKNPPAYIFTALARWGVLRAHPEYVSREEVEAEAAAAELKRRRDAAEALEAARFERWAASLSEEETAAIMAKSPGGPKEQWFKNYWRRHVRDA